jgi:hypothetical protein
MKAIPTIYSGYKFRSRLEARWACFFDALDVAYEYEPEGYALDGINYLPDFRITQPGSRARYWLEVKGQRPTPDEIEKARRLSQSGNACFLVWGDPVDALMLTAGGVMVCTTNRASLPLMDKAASVNLAWILCRLDYERLHDAAIAARQRRFEER